MYCSQCGKKVAENMLFCPFCGSPIVIPDQEAPAKTESEPKSAFAPQPPIHLFEDQEEQEEQAEPEFEPLDVERLKDELRREEETRKAEQKPAAKRGLEPDRIQPVRTVPDVSLRDFDVNDMFMGEDDWQDDDEDDEDNEDYRYEEPEEGGFVARHIRGLVTLALFALVLAVVAGWAFSSAGQRSLARAGLAWSPSAYADIAYDAYQAGNYAQSGGYYAQALSRDSGNYDYANYAGIAYYMAQDTLRAEEMARRAISIDADRAEGYQILARLYPDATTRAADITALIQQGYRHTGDETLKAALGE